MISRDDAVPAELLRGHKAGASYRTDGTVSLLLTTMLTALMMLAFLGPLGAEAKCNPKQDTSCCRDLKTGRRQCEMWTMVSPERCESDKFVKKCRASCHAEYPLMGYCEPSPASLTSLQNKIDDQATEIGELRSRIEAIVSASGATDVQAQMVGVKEEVAETKALLQAQMVGVKEEVAETKALLQQLQQTVEDLEPSPPICNSYTSAGANTKEAATISLNPAVGGGWGQMLGAHTGTYTDALQDKCCSVCSSGSYGGVSYSFATDNTGNTATTCKGFRLAFIDDPSVGFYCQFTNAAQSKGFTASGSYTISTFYYESGESLYYLPSPPPPSPPPSPPPPVPPSAFADRAGLKAAVDAWTPPDNGPDPASVWDTSRVKDLSGETDNTGFFPRNFNGEITNWDTSAVTTMEYTFLGASAFNTELRWDTSKVATMRGTFLEAAKFNRQLVWDTSRVTDMEIMFRDDHDRPGMAFHPWPYAMNEVLCDDSCGGFSGAYWYAGDGVCDDGGPGSDYANCELGTDCLDCPERTFSGVSIVNWDVSNVWNFRDMFRGTALAGDNCLKEAISASWGAQNCLFWEEEDYGYGDLFDLGYPGWGDESPTCVGGDQGRRLDDEVPADTKVAALQAKNNELEEKPTAAQ